MPCYVTGILNTHFDMLNADLQHAARKMVYKMLDGQAERDGLYYFENIEGGHGGAADSDQRARVTSLIYDFMDKALE